MKETLVPTNVRQAWRAGAEAEAKARDEGLDRETAGLRDYVVACARSGRNRAWIVESVALVYTAGWPWRKRLSLAWRLVRR